ncbi:MAG: aminotransferase class IV [Gemmatimonadales bacterium]
MTAIAFHNGTFQAKADIRISPEDRGFLFADGVYEVARAYGGRFFELDAHLARLRDGLAALMIGGAQVEALPAIFAELLTRNALATSDALVYLQITRGAAPRTHFFPDPAVPPTVYAEARAFQPKADPRKGIAVITTPDTRWARCDIKSVALLPNVLANQQARAAGATEAVFVRDGVALEGSSSSFFAIVDGDVRTAPCSNYILPSISRRVTLELCREAGFPHRETPIFLHELPKASEMFMAGTTLEVMPVVAVDGRPVAGGTPGPMATELARRFHARALA